MRLLLAVLTLSATPASAQTNGRCSYPHDTISLTGLSLRSLAGTYDLEWHSIVRDSPDRHRRERLWLWPTESTDSSLTSPQARPAPNDTLRYPLYGAIASSTSRVDAGDSLHRATDPLFPLVLLEASQHGAPPILVLGKSYRGLPNLTLSDWAGITVSLTAITPPKFVGIFRSWGMVGPADSGFVCAVRFR
jgi:hypothetical protein